MRSFTEADAAQWRTEIDSLKTGLETAGIASPILEEAGTYVDRCLETDGLRALQVLLHLYACVSFACGQLGDLDRFHQLLVTE